MNKVDLKRAAVTGNIMKSITTATMEARRTKEKTFREPETAAAEETKK